MVPLWSRFRINHQREIVSFQLRNSVFEVTFAASGDFTIVEVQLCMAVVVADAAPAAVGHGQMTGGGDGGIQAQSASPRASRRSG